MVALMEEYERALSELSLSLRVLRKQVERERWGDAGIATAATFDRADVVSRIKQQSVVVGSRFAMAGFEVAIVDLYRHLTTMSVHVAATNRGLAMSHADEVRRNIEWLLMAADFVDLHPMPGEESW